MSQLTPKKLHDESMVLYQNAIMAKVRGDDESYNSLVFQAYELESAAAELLFDRHSAEPTRGLLYRGAATLALKCQKFIEAEKLAMKGLLGNPESDIAEELKDIYEQCNFERHLSAKGLVLDGNEFMMTLASGSEVKKGMAKGSEIIQRADGVEMLYKRTVDRMEHRPFKKTPAKSTENEHSVYWGIQKAASYGIVFRVARPSNTIEVPGMERSAVFINEMLECIKLVNDNKIEDLRGRIPDESYFQNFIHTMRDIAPDGDRVSMVGFTTHREDGEVMQPLSRVSAEIEFMSPIKKELEPIVETGQIYDIVGQLLEGSLKKNVIKIVSRVPAKKEGKEKDKMNTIFTTNEAQVDVIKKFYGSKVVATVQISEEGKEMLCDIKQASVE